ncbi:MAG TPA: hypothetical protein VFB14_13920 [Bryobacteraceae bacterium]|nr:hypothetical protein [Bryobacteraceae bacterium]
MTAERRKEIYADIRNAAAKIRKIAREIHQTEATAEDTAGLISHARNIDAWTHELELGEEERLALRSAAHSPEARRPKP